MKKLRFILSGLLFCVIGIQQVNAADSASIMINATITATCSLEVPASVSLGDIPASAFAGKENGDLLTSYTADITLTSSCIGTDNHKYIFSSSKIAGKCVAADKDFIGFCLNAGDTELDFTSGRAEYTVANEQVTTVVTVTPQVLSQSIESGKIEASVEVVIEPV